MKRFLILAIALSMLGGTAQAGKTQMIPLSAAIVKTPVDKSDVLVIVEKELPKQPSEVSRSYSVYNEKGKQFTVKFDDALVEGTPIHTGDMLLIHHTDSGDVFYDNQTAPAVTKYIVPGLSKN